MSLFPVHAETYKIDGREYRAVANFADDTLAIQSRGFLHNCTLTEYSNFDGNMLDFVKAKIKELER